LRHRYSPDKSGRTRLSFQYIRDVFEVSDIDKVWNELEQRFHFNVKAWKKEFEITAADSERFKDVQELFLEKEDGG
jgi:hypothetical protein